MIGGTISPGGHHFTHLVLGRLIDGVVRFGKEPVNAIPKSGGIGIECILSNRIEKIEEGQLEWRRTL
jgi:hypothetical protein